MTSSSARLASSWVGEDAELLPGLMGDTCWVVVTGVIAGSGGGCIEFVLCSGRPDCIVSSTPLSGGSDIGDSSAVVVTYRGVSASDDGGGDP